MTITYSNLLKGYIVEIPRKGGKSMITVKRTRLEALKVGLERLVFIKQ